MTTYILLALLVLAVPLALITARLYYNEYRKFLADLYCENAPDHIHWPGMNGVCYYCGKPVIVTKN